MILVNWLLAFGALAFTVPLAIHLLFRNRFRTIDWGAMRFLQAVVRQNRRRLQLRDLLLLLIRCAIPVLLALAMARPVLTGWQQPRGDSPVALALLLDTSYSLAAMDHDRSRFDTLVEAARRVVGSLGRGSEITLVSGDGRSTTSDAQGILRRLDRLRIGGGSLDLDDLVGRGLRALADSSLSNRQIVLLTDQAASAYSQSTLDGLPSLAQRIGAVTPPPEIDWIDPFDQPPAGRGNLRLHRVEPAARVAAPGQSVPWYLEARIDGQPPRSVEFRIQVNGQPQAQQSVVVRDASATATIPISVDSVGRHVVEVAVVPDADHPSLASGDDFPPDDRRWETFRVLDPIDVWLVDGTPSDRPLASDTDYLAIALSPFSLSRQAVADGVAEDLFRTRKLPLGRLAEGVGEGPAPALVVLANVESPAEADSRWLVDYVQRRGGTLVVFAGTSIDPEGWEMTLRSAAGQPLLPLAFGPRQTLTAGAAIDDSRLTYPPLTVFSERERGSLAAATVRTWLDLLPRSPAEEDSEDPAGQPRRGAGDTAQVILRLEDGQPLVAVGQAGRGRVVQVATSCDDSWTTLPLRPVYVPLMQRLFSHFAVAQQGTALVEAGQPLTLSGVAPGSRWTVTTPTGRSETVTASTADEAGGVGDQAGRLRWTATSRAGAYRFAADDDDDQRVIWAAVNVPEADLRPELAEPATRLRAAEQLGARSHRSVEAFLTDDANRRFGRGIWQYLLAALVAAMLLEPVIQQRRIGASKTA